jgi:cystathionine beta-lyase/cystathionine gamma-synthase
MSHESLSTEKREEIGIKDSLIRLSIGIEDPDDLLQDLRSALNGN